MPPLAGPRAVLCCTRWPVNTRVVPSSMRTGIATVSARLGVLRTARIPSSSSRRFAACSKYDWAIAKGFRFSRVITFDCAMGVPRMRGSARSGCGRRAPSFVGELHVPAMRLIHGILRALADIVHGGKLILEGFERGAPGPRAGAARLQRGQV